MSAPGRTDSTIRRSGLLARLQRWLRMADYDEEREAATARIIAETGRD